MSRQEFVDRAKQAIASLVLPSDRVKELQSILSAEQKRPVSYKEAEEVGSELIALFESLASGRPIITDEEGYRDG